MRIVGLILIGISATTEGCGQTVEPVRTGAEAVQTDRAQYRLRQEGIGFKTQIPFSFRNPLPDTVYMFNCGGALDMSLEKKVQGGWEWFWGPVLFECLSAPVVIPPGTRYQDTLEVFGVQPGRNAAPAFRTNDIEGTYRLVWNNLVLHYRDSGMTFGDSLALSLRRSNEFQLFHQP